jgi:hypothetical protein
LNPTKPTHRPLASLKLPKPIRPRGRRGGLKVMYNPIPCRVVTPRDGRLPQGRVIDRLAAAIQRVEVPSRQAPKHRVAGPGYVERSAVPKPDVESLYGGSNNAGRNMK